MRTVVTLLITLILVVGFALLLPRRHDEQPRRPEQRSERMPRKQDVGRAIERGASDGLQRLKTVVRRLRRTLLLGARARALREGWREFTAEVPEDICFRDYDYIRLVEAAGRKRWFAPQQRREYEAAQEALTKTLEHRRRLIGDHQFRAVDAMRARIAHDPLLKDYVFGTRWAPPFLICCTAGERMANQELLFEVDDEDTRARRDAMLKERERLGRRVDGKYRMLQQLYTEFLGRYQKPLRLKDLAAEFGGRDDMPTGTRSFHDGAPLVVWIFEDHAAFLKHHDEVMRRPISYSTRGYFSPSLGWVFAHDEGDGPADRRREIHTLLGCASHQLVYWFSRQRHRWRRPYATQHFLVDGFARWMAGVTVTQHWKVEFTGIQLHELVQLQQMPQILSEMDSVHALFPLKTLVSLSSYYEAGSYAEVQWGIPSDLGEGMFKQQSYALVLFLDEYDEGRYREAFVRFFDRVLDGESWSHAPRSFAESFRLLDDEDWERLEGEFHDFMRDDLMKRDLKPYEWEPPPRSR